MPETDVQPLVALREARIGFGSRTLLEGVNLEIRPGRVTLVAGPNGCGKTTLLRTLLGLVPPQSGELRGPLAPAAYVPQSTHARAGLPIAVVEVVAMGTAGLPGLTHAERSERTQAALARVGASHLARRPIQPLSGGERQRVWIARALVAQPRLLALDEPASQLDPDTRDQILELLLDLAQRDRTGIVAVTHDPDWHAREGIDVLRIADQRLRAISS